VDVVDLVVTAVAVVVVEVVSATVVAVVVPAEAVEASVTVAAVEVVAVPLVLAVEVVVLLVAVVLPAVAAVLVVVPRLSLSLTVTPVFSSLAAARRTCLSPKTLRLELLSTARSASPLRVPQLRMVPSPRTSTVSGTPSVLSWPLVSWVVLMTST
jgi:hypothetical protein